MAIPPHYRTLGLAPTANDEDIKQAYRALAKKFHPDTNQGDPRSEEFFKSITIAYKVLSDPQERESYNRQYGIATKPTKPKKPVVPLAPEDGRNIRMKLFLTVEEAQQGGAREVKYQRDTTCIVCGGEGRGVSSRDTCGTCKGSGIIFADYTARIEYPAGIRHLEEMQIIGAGHQGRKISGQLLVAIHYKDNQYLNVRGDDLHYHYFLSLEQYIEGGRVPVPTVNGLIHVKIPARFPDGGTLRLKGRGLIKNDNHPAGNLIISVEHCLPVKLSRKERTTLRKLMTFSGFNPPVDTQGLIPKGEE